MIYAGSGHVPLDLSRMKWVTGINDMGYGKRKAMHRFSTRRLRSVQKGFFEIMKIILH